ncbi:RHS repeat-associated core domain-containing protein [Edaphovirga cremea]|uniref:RHS repeat-associated core domain-containing protein n=1 Tax=Edaphovirga cremea TaxID=2267246 RepID=UPI003988CA46
MKTEDLIMAIKDTAFTMTITEQMNADGRYPSVSTTSADVTITLNFDTKGGAEKAGSYLIIYLPDGFETDSADIPGVPVDSWNWRTAGDFVKIDVLVDGFVWTSCVLNLFIAGDYQGPYNTQVTLSVEYYHADNFATPTATLQAGMFIEPHTTIMNNISLGYTGQRRSALSGSYVLGNGYRGFNPVVKRFASQDTMSPFGPGGVHGYAYCGSNPVNHADPSGHLFWELAVAFEGLIDGLEASEAENFAIKEGVDMAAESISTKKLAKGSTLYKSSVFENFNLSLADESDNDWSGTYFALNENVSEGYLADYISPDNKMAYLHKFEVIKDIKLFQFSDTFLADGTIPQEVKAKKLKEILKTKGIFRNNRVKESEKFTQILETHGYGYKGSVTEGEHEIILRNNLKIRLRSVGTTTYVYDAHEIMGYKKI